jgi:hypothetical protein
MWNQNLCQLQNNELLGRRPARRQAAEEQEERASEDQPTVSRSIYK